MDITAMLVHLLFFFWAPHPLHHPLQDTGQISETHAFYYTADHYNIPLNRKQSGKQNFPDCFVRGLLHRSGRLVFGCIPLFFLIHNNGHRTVSCDIQAGTEHIENTVNACYKGQTFNWQTNRLQNHGQHD